MYENEEEIEIYHIENEIINPELSILVRLNKEYEISIKNRNDKKIVINNKQKDFIIAAVVILCKKIFEHPKNDTEIIRKLRNLVEECNLEDANKLLEEKLDKKLYSMKEKNFSKICMIVKGDKVDIVYHEKYILKGIPISRGYIVLYNYTKLLNTFYKIFKALSSELSINNKYDELAELYIF